MAGPNQCGWGGGGGLHILPPVFPPFLYFTFNGNASPQNR